MIDATFYTLNKRKNSTIIPGNSSGTTIHVDLKGDCSVQSPTLLLRISNPSAYNYCYIPEFNRYYFISDWVAMNSTQWECTCKVDVLASFKSDIKAIRAYVVNSASFYSPLITDNRIPIDNATRIIERNGSSTSTPFSGSRSFYLTVLGGGADRSTPFSSTYELTKAQAAGIANYLSNVSGDIMNDLKEQFGNVFGCVISGVMIPANTARTSGSDGAQINLGKYNSGASGKLLSSHILNGLWEIEIPWQTDDFRRNSPYTDIALYLPFAGVSHINPIDLINNTFVHIEASLNLLTGDVLYEVGGSDGALVDSMIGIYSGNCGQKVPITQYIGNAAGQIQGIAQMAAGAATAFFNPAAGGAQLASGVINTAIASMEYTPSILGGNSGGLGEEFGYSPKLIMRYHPTSVEPDTITSTLGRPAQRVANLSALHGYVQTSGASVGGTMTDNEKREINSLLDSGIYLE